METLTDQATELSLNQDDKNQISMSLGNATPNQNVSNEFPTTPQETWEKINEEEKSHGEYQTEVERAQAEIDRYQELEDKILKELDKHYLIRNGANIKKWLNEIIGNENVKKIPYYYSLINSEKIQELKNEIKTELDTKRQEKYNIINDIKSSGEYDYRSDKEKREDTEQLRKSEDLAAAGLSKGIMYSGGGGGGSSGATTKEEEEERKRKRRKEQQMRQEELERQRRAETMRLISGLVMSAAVGTPRMLNASTNIERLAETNRANQAREEIQGIRAQTGIDRLEETKSKNWFERAVKEEQHNQRERESSRRDNDNIRKQEKHNAWKYDRMFK